MAARAAAAIRGRACGDRCGARAPEFGARRRTRTARSSGCGGPAGRCCSGATIRRRGARPDFDREREIEALLARPSRAFAELSARPASARAIRSTRHRTRARTRRRDRRGRASMARRSTTAGKRRSSICSRTGSSRKRKGGGARIAAASRASRCSDAREQLIARARRRSSGTPTPIWPRRCTTTSRRPRRLRGRKQARARSTSSTC